MSADIQERVARGVALLDATEPGWVHRINTEKLDVSHGEACVLGQLYGNYTLGRHALGLDHNQAGEHGFQMRTPSIEPPRGLLVRVLNGFAEYPDLTQEWRRVVEILKTEQVLVKIPLKELTLV